MDETEKIGGEPIGGPLILRDGSERTWRTFGPDDYDVMSDGRIIEQ
jgi:hypothetical protein